MAEERNALNTRDFSKVILTLNNVEIPEEKLSPTPSEKDGLNAEDEADLRILGCELIQTSGILLKLPQVAMATGQVLFQRFYYSKSFIKHPMEVVAMACVTLASKIEEAPRRFRDVISVFHHIKQVRAGKTISPMILDGNYINLKNQVIKAERRILKELGFCVHVKHPHKIIVMYLQVLECERNQRLVQYAWNYMNDSFRTNVFVRFRPETIACACIYLAARQLKIVLPNNPHWYGLFEAKESELREISLMIMRLYTRPKPNPERLEQIVNELKKVSVEAKLRAKGASNNATPNSGSRPATPSRVDSPMFAQLRRVKMEDDRKSEQSFGKDLPKKRSHSPDSRDSLSISHSRSRSRSPHSSKSRSRSPAAKRRPRTPPKYKEREKKPKYDKYSYDSGRYSRNDKYTSSSKDRNDKYYYEDSRYVKKDKYSSRERDYYDHKDYKPKKPSPIIYTRERSPSYSPEVRMKKKYKEKHKARSRSRSYDKYEAKRKSKKHANGHRRSRSRDQYKKSM